MMGAAITGAARESSASSRGQRKWRLNVGQSTRAPGSTRPTRSAKTSQAASPCRWSAASKLATSFWVSRPSLSLSASLKILSKSSSNLSLPRRMQPATNSVQPTAPERLRSRASAEARAGSRSTPRRSSARATWSLVSWPLAPASNSRKAALMVGSWFDGQAWAMDNATLLCSTLRSGTCTSPLRSAATLPSASSEIPRASKNGARRHCEAVGRMCRSSRSIRRHSSTAALDACRVRLQGASGMENQ
mmetsp:Transcript_54135/g.141024  ORF Transcript_54135/g.141024 Transcript_54135/m.141024 type:complete len:247 (+) Transcript_54135:246-986(+)